MESHLIRRQSLSDEVKKVLKEYIYSMDPHESTKLPSENEIAQNYGVSRVTVRKVLDELEQEGLIYPVKGKGNFISDVGEIRRISLNSYKTELKVLVEKGKNIGIREDELMSVIRECYREDRL